MRRLFGIILLVVLVLSAAGCSSQHPDKAAAKGSAQVRVACMFFPLADVSVDDQVVLDDMVYPFISDYLTVSAGSHTVKVVSSNSDKDAASLDLKLDDGHSYLVVSYGNLFTKSNHTLLLIDETETWTKVSEDQNWVLLLHLMAGAPAFDGYVEDERVLQDFSFGESYLYPVPARKFDMHMTLVDQPDLVIYQDESNGLPSTYTVVALTGTLLNPTMVYDVRSPKTLAEMFTGVAQVGEYYDTWLEMLQKSGVLEDLKGPGPFTMFAPWDADFINVSSDAILADPARLLDVLHYNIVPENLPPYVLFHRPELTTLQGASLTVATTDADPFFLLNGSTKVYQDYRASNGVFYEVDGVLLPQ
jgi:hypothetical protein